MKYESSIQEMATIVRNRVPLFNKTDAIHLLDFLEGQGLGVLGIEGFTINGSHRIPRQDLIADFSSLFDKEETAESSTMSLQASRVFFAQLTDSDEEVLFEFVFDKI